MNSNLDMETTTHGPLHGITIIEFASKGPGPMCGMLLGDMGADVIRIERPAIASEIEKSEQAFSILHRNRRSIALNLQTEEGKLAARRLVAGADGLLEGFRPGVMERIGLSSELCLEDNPRLVYGRVTGWGRSGPLAPRAGHDINYLALTGALNAIGLRGSVPVPPLNLLADYGGGALYLAFGMVCALFEARRSGKGQVVDVAMTDAVASLMTAIQGLHNAGQWVPERGRNLLDSGAPFYTTYETSDGKFMAIGPIEPQFFVQFIELTGTPGAAFNDRMNPDNWAQQTELLRAIFKKKTRAEWESIYEGTDACVTPVLSMGEAPDHPHNVARGTYELFAGALQAAPVPRLSRTPGSLRLPAPEPGAHGIEILRAARFTEQEMAMLADCGAFTAPVANTTLGDRN